MKLTCTRDNLHQGLSITSHLMTKNVNLPILQNVMVKAEGGTIKFTTTNLEMAVNCVVRGKVEESGEYTIPSKLFFDYVSLLPNDTIQLEVDNHRVDVSCGTQKTQINGLSASEFPLVPQVDGEQLIEIPVADLRESISQVLFAVATNESRPELTGVLFKFSPFSNEGRLILTSTDSYRLTEKTIATISPIEKNFSVIIPSKTLSELSRILSVFKDDEDLPTGVTMNISSNQVVFVYGPVELISRTIEEQYPAYESIIPTQFQTEAIVDRSDLTKAVKTASLFSRTGLFDVTLEFDTTTGKVSVKGLDATRGENVSSCDSQIIGQSNSVTVNFRYLLDGLGAISTNEVVFKMIDLNNPCLITAKKNDPDYKYILMPIKQ